MADFATRLRQLRDYSSQQWLDALTRVGPPVVSTVLVVALAWQLVQLTWLFTGNASGTAISVPGIISGTGPTVARSSPVDLKSIVDSHLFGVATEGPDPSAVQSAPQTQMNLVLTGTMAANDPEKGYAIIGESTAAAKTYATGATLRPGTKLHSVYADRVILDNGGRLETLVLPRQNSGGAVMGRPAPIPAAASGSIGDDLRRIAEANPGAFSAVVRPQPVFANGVQRGYRVYPGRDRRQFAQLGLQPGDLVTSINGTPLDDPARGMEIFNSLNSASSVNVTVERNGQTQQLTLNTAQLAAPGSAGPESEPQPADPQPPEPASVPERTPENPAEPTQ